MKYQSVSSLGRVWSMLDNALQPDHSWSVQMHPGAPGVLLETVEAITELSSGWVGWACTADGYCILFEHKEDAMYAQLSLGEDLYVN